MFFQVLGCWLVVLLGVVNGWSSPPSPSGSADVVLGVFYAPDPPKLPQVAIDLSGSASTTITMAAWVLTDSRVVTSLCTAATNGRTVHVAIPAPSSTASAAWRQAERLVASGGTVWSCDFPQHIANNFMVADGVYTLQGNYYFSPTAIQAGSYLMAVSGTHAATVNAATFGNLIASGTPIAADFGPMLEAPQVFVLDREGRPDWIGPRWSAVGRRATAGSCSADVCGPMQEGFAFPSSPSPMPSLTPACRMPRLAPRCWVPRLRPRVAVAESSAVVRVRFRTLRVDAASP